MKKIFILFSMASLILFTACEDEVDVEGLMKYPPTIVSVTPKSTVKAGDFDIKVVFAEGPKTPLSSATLVLKDALSNEVVSVTEALTGISDSVVVKGADFDAASLGLGDYTLTIIASDVDNNEVRSEVKFKISDQLFAANHSAMYIAGAFNGWGSGRGTMELIADNTWEIKEVDLQAGQWKFRNTDDWSDVDWGDTNCDGEMEIQTGNSNGNTNCGYEGLVNIRFNDETLKYTITPAVTFASNISGLYLLGTFNDFEGPPDYKFTLTADHTWELDEIRLKPGYKFKFAETKKFQGKNFGDVENDGTAEEFGPNITVADDDAFYKIIFNDETLKYTLTFVRPAYELFLVGNASTAGWNPSAAIPFRKIGEKKYEIYAYLTTGVDVGFKFLIIQDWAGDWGVDPDNAGKVVQDGEANAEVDHDGFYRVTVDLLNTTYEVVETNWAIVGDATPGGWGPDTDMTYAGDNTWEVDVTLTSGEFKFRANDDWPINMGVDTGNLLKQDGGNIASPGPGNYHVEIVFDSVNGYTYSITLN